MLNIAIPGKGDISLRYAVFDMNGTLTTDGKLSENIKILLNNLAKKLQIIILTADTFGKAKEVFSNLPVELHILKGNNTTEEKLNFIKKLNSENCVTIGNGNNDRLMLKFSALGIAIVGDEGTSSLAINSADIVCNSIENAIELLLNEKRIIATLRN